MCWPVARLHALTSCDRGCGFKSDKNENAKAHAVQVEPCGQQRHGANSVDDDMHDPAAQCSTGQLAWLDLLKDLAGFFTSELKLLSQVSRSEDLASSYKSNLQGDVWKGSVKEMRAVLSEVCP
jgi:hypothetical protein